MTWWFYSRKCLVRPRQIIIEKPYSVTLSNHHNRNSLFSVTGSVCINTAYVSVRTCTSSQAGILFMPVECLYETTGSSQGEKHTPPLLPLSLCVCVSPFLLCSLRCKPVTHRHQRETQRARYNWCGKHQTQEGRILYNGEATACRFPIYLHFWPL